MEHMAPLEIKIQGGEASVDPNSASGLLLRRSHRHAPKSNILVNEEDSDRDIAAAFMGTSPSPKSPAASPTPKGTQAQRRRAQRGRAPSSEGRRHGKGRPRATLTNEQAAEIYSLRGLGEGKSSEIALTFDVAPKTIRDIWNRRTWAHATRTQWSKDEVTSHHRNCAPLVRSPPHSTRKYAASPKIGKDGVQIKPRNKKKSITDYSDSDSSDEGDSQSNTSCSASPKATSTISIVTPSKIVSCSPPISRTSSGTSSASSACRRSKASTPFLEFEKEDLPVIKQTKKIPCRRVGKVPTPRRGPSPESVCLDIRNEIFNRPNIKVHFKVGNENEADTTSGPCHGNMGRGKELMVSNCASADSFRHASKSNDLQHVLPSRYGGHCSMSLVERLHERPTGMQASSFSTRCVDQGPFGRNDLYSRGRDTTTSAYAAKRATAKFAVGNNFSSVYYQSEQSPRVSRASNCTEEYESSRDIYTEKPAMCTGNKCLALWEDYSGDQYHDSSDLCDDDGASGLCQGVGCMPMSDVSDTEDVNGDEHESSDWMDYALSSASLNKALTTPPADSSAIGYFSLADDSNIVYASGQCTFEALC